MDGLWPSIEEPRNFYCVTLFISVSTQELAMSRGFPSMTALFGLIAIAG